MTENNKRIPRENQKQFNKCLFEDDFSEASSANDHQSDTTQENSHSNSTSPQPLTQEDLAQAESQGYAKGLADGKQQAFEDHNAELKKHTEKLTAALQDIDNARAEIAEDITQKAFALLEIIADTLLSDARQHYPGDLLKPALDILTDLTHEQKQNLMVYTSTETQEYLTQTLLKSNNTPPLNEENIRTDSTLSPGDCLITWAEGGVELKRDALKENINQTLQRAAKSDTEQKTAANHAGADEDEAAAPLKNESPQNETKESE